MLLIIVFYWLFLLLIHSITLSTIIAIDKDNVSVNIVTKTLLFNALLYFAKKSLMNIIIGYWKIYIQTTFFRPITAIMFHIFFELLFSKYLRNNKKMHAEQNGVVMKNSPFEESEK